MITLPKVKFIVKFGSSLTPDFSTLYHFGKAPREEDLYEKISIKEFQKVSVTLESDHSQDYLEIETFDSDEKKKVYAGQTITIINGNSEDMLVPGDYPIVVYTNEQKYEAMYRIAPHNLSWDAYFNLRSYIEEKVQGMSYNLLKNRSGALGDGFDHLPNDLRIFQYIQENSRYIKLQLQLIFQDPLYRLKKEYIERTGARKTDAKSQRWLATKGISRNSNTYMPIVVQERKAKLTFDTSENHWLKHMLSYARFSLRKIETKFYENIKIVEVQIQTIEKEIKNAEVNRQEILNQQYQNFKKLLLETNQLIKSKKAQLETKEFKIKKLKENYELLKRLISTFALYEQEFWLQKLPKKISILKPTVRLLKDRRYSSLYRFYQALKDVQKKESSFQKQAFPYKHTALLFEQYSFFIVLDIITDLGFQQKEGLLVDALNNNELGLHELEEGQKVKFENSDVVIFVEYERKIFNTSNPNESHFFSPGSSNHPDIFVTIYKKESMSLLSGFALDAKYRGSMHLWNQNMVTDTISQLLDYKNISYYDAEKKSGLLPIAQENDPIVLYPRQKGAKAKWRHHYGIQFVQIEPSNPCDGEPFGYENLKGLVEEYIKRSINNILVK